MNMWYMRKGNMGGEQLVMQMVLNRIWISVSWLKFLECQALG